MNIPNKSRGFTLVEVLVALIILAVGLLSMATLMMTSLQSSQGAYLRSQASLLTYDIVERMRANYTQATTTDAYVLTKGASASSNPNCKTSGCDASNQAQQDIHDWRKSLTDSIPGANAQIARANLNQYTIEISWDDSGQNLGTGSTPSSFSLRVDL
ncbi:MAG: type IV pilus modification protein PilV [Pseudomonas sp.]